MNLHIPTPRIGLAAFLLIMPCFGASSLLGLDPLRDDPPPPREAIDTGLTKHRADLLKVEEYVRGLRDEVKLQLTDFVAGQKVAVLKAQKAYNDAKLARGKAEFAIKEYAAGIYLQDHAVAQGKIALAKADLERARDAWRELDRQRGQGPPVDPIKFLKAQLDLQEAEFDEEQAQLELKILTAYTKDKETKSRQASLAAAESIEAEKEGLLKAEQAKAAKLGEQAERFKVRAPEDLILALLDGAIEDKGKVVALVVDSQKIETQVREKPGDAATLIEQLRAKKAEAEASMIRAKAKLLEATTLAEQVKSLRAKLRDAEAHLKKRQELLEILERELAPKP